MDSEETPAGSADSGHLAAQPGGRPAAGTSPWAMAALACSLAVFCPAMTVLGPLLALRALVDIKAHPLRSGRRMAIAAIVIGVSVTITWAAGAYWWHANARLKMLHGPAAEIQAGQRGDLASFKSGFLSDAAAPDREAAAFLAELSQRYGRLISSRLNREASADQSNVPAGSYRLRYSMQFESGPVVAEARFAVTADGRPPWVLKFAWLRVVDAERGDLLYPQAARSEIAAPMP